MDGGLFVLQQLAIILAYVCSKDRHSLPIIQQQLAQYDLSLVDVLGVIRDILMTLQSNDGGENNVTQGFDENDRAVLESWSANIASFIDANP